MLHVSFSNMFDFIVAKTKIQWYLGDTSENGRRQYPVRNQLDTRGGEREKSKHLMNTLHQRSVVWLRTHTWT